MTSFTWNGGGSLRSAGRGMNLSSTGVSMSGVRIANNGTDGAFITPGSAGTAIGCDFYGNGTATNSGLDNISTTFMIDAHNSWWGDPSGPYDPSNGPPDFNPTGLGSKVSDYVIYRPWATGPNTNEPPSSFVLLSPAQGDSVPRGSVHLLWSHSVALDGGPISYDLLVDNNPDFSSPVVNASES